MTKVESYKCDRLLEEALNKMKRSEMAFAKSEIFLKDGNELEWETEQRKGDQYYGEAVGIHQVLAALGFKHDRMKELSDLL